MKKKDKTANKNEKKRKRKTKTKMKNKMKAKIKTFCVFVNSTWPRGAIDGQLSLTWPRSAIAFSFANFARGLAVP